MNLQTNIPLLKVLENQISYSSKIVLLGSCFSDNIGQKLSYYKFQSHQNPFGILFHPKAIENLIVRAINKEFYTADELVCNNERWHCLDAHSSLSSSNKDDLLSTLNLNLRQTRERLEAATHVIITLGTSWVYRYLKTDAIVANCHKIPQTNFSKELLSTAEISSALKNIITSISGINKNSTVLFTVSPVRHIKDGFVENTRSKAHLITAVHNSITAHQNTHYFPSYELMMDELRGYRFYEEDMLHPTKTAIQYIWERFVTTWFHVTVEDTMKTIENIQRGLAHRPFNEQSSSHQLFLADLEKKKQKVQEKFSFINF